MQKPIFNLDPETGKTTVTYQTFDAKYPADLERVIAAKKSQSIIEKFIELMILTSKEVELITPEKEWVECQLFLQSVDDYEQIYDDAKDLYDTYLATQETDTPMVRPEWSHEQSNVYQAVTVRSNLEESYGWLAAYRGKIADSRPETKVSQEEIESWKIANYVMLRKAAYPPLGDQLDSIWKGGQEKTDMEAQVMQVKADWPKE